MNHGKFALVGLLLLAGAGCTPGPVVSSFAECVTAGYPVAESYPRQCIADSVIYTEDIGNAIEKQDLIRVTSPQPNETIASPLIITGEARGTWYFEATFPVDVETVDGTNIGGGYAQADDDWMTEDFVPFTSTIGFTVPDGVDNGYLILRRSNASGLPENDDELRVPVNF